MKEWEFEELIEAVTVCFKRELQDGDSIYACSRSFYEYDPVIKEGLAESIIVHVTIGKLMFKYSNKIFVGQLKLIEEAINSFNATVLSSELELEEIQTLRRDIDDLVNCIKNAEITYP